MMEEPFSLLSEYLGISETAIAIIFSNLSAIGFCILVYQSSMNFRVSIFFSIFPIIICSIFGIIPFASLCIYFLICVFLVILNYNVGTDKIYYREFDWISYGERLKLAYSARFDGENLGFNDEVNKRVNILVNSDRGITRLWAKDWMNRMSKFTGVKWLKLEDSRNVK